MKSVNAILENEIKRLAKLNPDFWHSIKGAMNGLTGLNPGWLSDYLDVPDGVSLNEFLRKKYGDETADIVYKLCTTSADLSE